jgi:hypothetical protein
MTDGTATRCGAAWPPTAPDAPPQVSLPGTPPQVSLPGTLPEVRLAGMAPQVSLPGTPPRISRPRGRASAEYRAAPDTRRRLQLALATIWLLDAVLQFQAVMFSRSFPQMLAEAAHGNPAIVAGPIVWSAHLIEHHLAAANASFASVQLLLALGIAWRPATRIALAASVGWALAIWWLGEGFGLVLTGTASPLTGAPGAVIIYALLAVLLWPARRDRPAPFVAGRTVGAGVARLAWLVLWGSLGYLAVQQAAQPPRVLSSAVAAMAPGEPGWLAWTDTRLGSLIGQHGLAVSVLLGVVLLLVAVSMYLPAPGARAGLLAAIVVAVMIGVAEAFGGILSGSGTDLNSGPLLALLALAYWPLTTVAPVANNPDGGDPVPIQPVPIQPDGGG